MKTFILILSMVFSVSVYSQKPHHPNHRPHPHPGPKKVIVVKPSPFRPAKIMVYHPIWGPKYAFHRRWVYFSKYNFYFDNWRNHYVFWNGSMWISQPAPPPAVINININSEKHDELKENEDDVDDIYQNNSAHQGEYKSE